MSDVKRVIFEVQVDIANCDLSFPEIAEKYGITLEDVCLVADEMNKLADCDQGCLPW
jgi:hypothetical protein